MAEAIVYFGLNRNGTTWLGNLLANNFGATTAYHELNFGVCELNPYRIQKQWEQNNTKHNFEQFLQSYKNSDIFISLEGEEMKYKAREYQNFFEFLLELISHKAEKDGSKFIAMKIEPMILEDEKRFQEFREALSSRFSKVHFISIQRDYQQYISSVIGLYKSNNNHTFQVFPVYTAEYYHYYNLIAKKIGALDGKQLNFNPELKDSIIKELETFLRTAAKKDPTDETLIINTSRSGNRLNFFQLSIHFILKNLGLVSLSIVRIIEQLRLKRNRNKRLWNERIKTAKEHPEALIKSFENSYEKKLIPFIRENYMNG